jgi:hypothetical protein
VGWWWAARPTKIASRFVSLFATGDFAMANEMISGAHWHSEHGLAVLYQGEPHAGPHRNVDDIAAMLEAQSRS